jgi:hypothetical protein
MNNYKKMGEWVHTSNLKVGDTIITETNYGRTTKEFRTLLSSTLDSSGKFMILKWITSQGKIVNTHQDAPSSWHEEPTVFLVMPIDEAHR